MGKIITMPDGSVLVDSMEAVLLDNIEVARYQDTSTDQENIAMELSGRVNRSQDRSSTLFLFDVEAAAEVAGHMMAYGYSVDPTMRAKTEKVVKDIATDHGWQM